MDNAPLCSIHKAAMNTPPQPLLDAAARCPDPEAVTARLERLAEAGADLTAPSLREILIPVLCSSGALSTWLIRHPSEISALTSPGDLFTPLTAEILTRWYHEARRPEAEPVADATRALRRMKYRAFLQITARDVALHRPIPETCAELSLVAQVACEQALRVARAHVEAQHGPALTPEGAPIPFVILGMGKLGGDELNYSSDIDLIYFYGQDEGDAGALTVHQHFKKISELLSRIINEPTEDGFVFRVDLRLRPEGRSGPLCNSLASAESYYESWGRLWERVAWLRARPIAGDLALGAELLQRLSPWIYRRTLDYGLLDKIRALKGDILQQRRAAQTLGLARGVDLKLDEGGIRAVEFSANALQLVHAGRTPALRTPSTLSALDRLWAAGLLTAEDHDQLAEAYLLFRRVEHRIQMEEERQTHRLPTGPRLTSLARRLGYDGDDPAGALTAELNAHRAPVAQIFEGILDQGRAPDAAPDGEEADEAMIRARLLLSGDDETRRGLLYEIGFADPSQGVHLLDIASRHPQSPLSTRGDVSQRRLGLWLLAALLQVAEPERALTHLTALIGALPAHGFQISLLLAHRRVARQLMEIFSASDFIAEAIARQPALIEVMAESRPVGDPAARLRARLAEGPGLDDPEARLEHLARSRQSLLVSIGIGDLAGVISPTEAEAALTGLAEETLRATLALAWDMMRPRYGSPPAARWCVLGLGKLGGAELSYGSDLDLIFLYEDTGESDGERPLTCQEWYTRLVKRTISLLSMPTGVGPLYEVDTRLRPGGSHGTLVTTLGRFRRHHQTHADTWERMALVRGRPVAGVPSFMAEIDEALVDYTYLRPAPADLRAEMSRLRRRMEVEIGRESEGRYNPKVGRGGLVDLEFIAQALQIEHGAAYPSLRTANTREALRALGQAELLLDGEGLLAAHTFLRRLEHRMRVVRGRANPELRTEPISLDRLGRRLGYRRDPLAPEGPAPGAALLHDYKTAVDYVRHRFDRLFCSEETR